jgi:hypothetical protein
MRRLEFAKRAKERVSGRCQPAPPPDLPSAYRVGGREGERAGTAKSPLSYTIMFLQCSAGEEIHGA